MNGVSVVHKISGRFRLKLAALPDRGVDCISLKNQVQTLAGVTSVRINPHIGAVIVQHDDRPDMLEMVTDLLARPLPQAKEGNPCMKVDSGLNPPFAAGMVLALAPFLPIHVRAAVTWLSVAKTVLKGFGTLFNRGVKVEVLDGAAVGLSAWRGDYMTANATQFLLQLGEYLQESTERRSEDLVKSLLLPIPTDAWVERGGTLIQIPVSEIVINDLVEVGMGELIPVDGEVIDGLARVNQASLTGETVPVKKEPGNGAISGTIVEEGRIRIRAVRVGSHTAIARIANFIETSLQEESNTQRLAHKLADQRVKFTFVMGALVYAMTRDLRRVVATFLVDFACGIKISTPVAFKSAMYRGAEYGVLFKGGQAIENLAAADVCLFDKTGTLTSGSLEVVHVRLFHEGCTEERFLSLVASVEEHSNHPVAEAVVKAANTRLLPHMQHGVVDFIVAHGLQTTMDGKPILVGSRHFLEEDEGISFAAHAAEINRMMEEGYLVLLVAREGQPLGMIALQDHLREDAVEVLRELRELGVTKLIMLTGDHRNKALQLSKELCLDDVYYELIPEDKAKIVKKLKKAGHRVALVGDGINDAPALAAADVGIAMPRGAELTRNTADIALLRDELYGVVEARKLAMRTMKVVRTNFNLAIGINGAIMTAAAMGRLSPVTTSVLHNGTSLAVLVNSLAGVHVSSASKTRDLMARLNRLATEDTCHKPGE